MGSRSAFRLTLLLVVLARTYGSNETENDLSAESPDVTCPPWMVFQDGKCLCSETLSNFNQLQRKFTVSAFCNRQTQTTYISSGTCVTHTNTSSIAEDIVIGDCPYIPFEDLNYIHGYLRPLPQTVSQLNSAMCGPLNRRGMLCRSCRQGYGVAVYSLGYPCAKCGANHKLNTLWYILLETVPITILYVIVVVFRIRATAPPLAGLVFLSHTILNVVKVRIIIYTTMVYSTTKAIQLGWLFGIFCCSIWSLDFFRGLVPPFCVNENINNLQATLLEYFSAFYPLVLILITLLAIELHGYNVRVVVWLWKPFNNCFARFRKTWNIRYSIVNAFSTFLLLSYSKILFVSFRLLYQSSIYNINGTRIGSALQFDPTMQNFDSSYAGISLMAILIICVFSVLPIALLVLYPTRPFQKLLRQFTCRAKHAIHLFVDTYQGCLKDGSDGTRDFRSVSTLYLILRFALLSLYIGDTRTVRSGATLIIFSLVLIAFGVGLAILKPYKVKYHNYTEFANFFLLGIVGIFIYTWFIFLENGYAVVTIIASILPHCAMIACVIYTICRGKVVVRWIRNRLLIPQTGRFEERGNATQGTLNQLLNRFKSSEDTSCDDELPDRFLNPEHYPKELTTNYTATESCNFTADDDNTVNSSM